MINFSVIIPSYNSSAHIEKCLDSVLANINDCDEVIVINDGSTDSTADILKKYTNKHNVKCIDQENKGPNAARNSGISVAKCDWILFIDSDDAFVSGAFDKIRNAINRYAADIYVYGVGFEIADKNKTISLKRPLRRIVTGSDVKKEVLFGDDYLGICWNKVYNRNFILNLSVKFLEDKGHGRDVLFTKEIGLKAQRLSYIDETLCMSTYSSESYSRSFSLKNIQSAIELSQRLVALAHEHNDSLYIKKGIEYAIGKHLRYITVVSAFRLKNFNDYILGVEKLSKSSFLYKNIEKIHDFKPRMKDIMMCSLCRYPRFLWYVAKTLDLCSVRPY